ncbi:RimJ/RimL family protein N-acetyltransferase [Streptomyces sp. NTH33]|uniref:GNAT family N-acetyltransferase n=1 Tax=Streptomyces sp. NTH33 TaxID=1735453 RepID=UPI000DA8A94F|nr:GNAT family protein [Streptomyces sp. NTH33]PZH17370.1 RimJ/RimL family protein N-acetyltransferase [Streptomyces sp. NTH33]
MYAISLGDDGAELRPLEPWHAAEFLAHLDRGRTFITRHIPFGANATDLDSARAILQAYADKRATDSGFLHGLWLEGKLVGGLLFRVFDAATGTCEIGCWLEPAGTGRGLVTRGARVLVDWAFDERGMHRVEWRASSANEASIKVARRLGMTREGVLRESFPYRGVRQDTEVWAVLAPEWREARAREGR